MDNKSNSSQEKDLFVEVNPSMIETGIIYDNFGWVEEQVHSTCEQSTAQCKYDIWWYTCCRQILYERHKQKELICSLQINFT